MSESQYAPICREGRRVIRAPFGRPASTRRLPLYLTMVDQPFARHGGRAYVRVTLGGLPTEMA